MNPIALAVKLIEHFEGCVLNAYQDSGGVWTIGIGHTKGVVPGQTCTREQAEAWLAEDLAALIGATKGLTPMKTIAYIDFGFNCGSGALQKLMSGRISLSSYGRKDKLGKVQPGLVKRRDFEIGLIAMES